jgi:hypothetical protein
MANRLCQRKPHWWQRITGRISLGAENLRTPQPRTDLRKFTTKQAFTTLLTDSPSFVVWKLPDDANVAYRQKDFLA